MTCKYFCKFILVLPLKKDYMITKYILLFFLISGDFSNIYKMEQRERRHGEIFRCSLPSGPKVNVNEISLMRKCWTFILLFCLYNPCWKQDLWGASLIRTPCLAWWHYSVAGERCSPMTVVFTFIEDLS